MGNLIFQEEKPAVSIDVIFDKDVPIEGIPLIPIISMNRIEAVIFRWYRILNSESDFPKLKDLEQKQKKNQENRKKYKNHKFKNFVLVSRQLIYEPTERDVGSNLVFIAKLPTMPNYYEGKTFFIFKFRKCFPQPTIPPPLVSEINQKMRSFEKRHRQNNNHQQEEGRMKLFLNVTSMNLMGFIFPEYVSKMRHSMYVKDVMKNFYPEIDLDVGKKIFNFRYRKLCVVHEARNRKSDIYCLNFVHPSESDYYIQQLYDDTYSAIKCSTPVNIKSFFPEYSHNATERRIRKMDSLVVYNRRNLDVDLSLKISKSQLLLGIGDEKEDRSKKKKKVIQYPSKMIQIVRLRYVGDDHEDLSFFHPEYSDSEESSGEDYEFYKNNENRNLFNNLISTEEKKNRKRKRRRILINVVNICFFPDEDEDEIILQIEMIKHFINLLNKTRSKEANLKNLLSQIPRSQKKKIIIKEEEEEEGENNNNNEIFSEEDYSSYPLIICGCGNSKVYNNSRIISALQTSKLRTTKDFLFRQREKLDWKYYFKYKNIRTYNNNKSKNANHQQQMNKRKSKKREYFDTFIIFQNRKNIEISRLTIIKKRKEREYIITNNNNKEKISSKEDNISDLIGHDDDDNSSSSSSPRQQKQQQEKKTLKKYVPNIGRKEIKKGFPNPFFVSESPPMQCEFTYIL